MTASRTLSSPPTGQEFFLAVLAELDRVANRGRPSWTVKTRLPVVVHAAQLSMLARLLLKAANQDWQDVFKHREKLDDLLAKAHQRAKHTWDAALTKTKPAERVKYLEAAKGIQPAIQKAVDYASKHVGLRDAPLSDFTTNVQDTLATLTGRIAELAAPKLGIGTPAGPSAGVPSSVYGAIALGMLAGGLAGRREMTPKEASAARIAVRLGSQKDETGGPEPKEVRRLRKTLKELGPHLPEQRA